MNLLNQLHLEFSAIGGLLLPVEFRQRFSLGKAKNEDLEYLNKNLLELFQNPNIISPLFTRMALENNRLALQIKMLNYSNDILNLIESELKK